MGWSRGGRTRGRWRPRLRELVGVELYLGHAIDAEGVRRRDLWREHIARVEGLDGEHVLVSLPGEDRVRCVHGAFVFPAEMAQAGTVRLTDPLPGRAA